MLIVLGMMIIIDLRNLYKGVCKFRFLLSRSALNDDERGKIDSEVQEFISTCTDYIKRIQKLVNACDNAGN